jgi:CheY-like chemotaxis protein
MTRFNKVMLVEDDPITLLICEKIMSINNFASSIVTCTNGQEAIDAIVKIHQEHQPLPDIILLDLNMPVMNGWQFLEWYSKWAASQSHTPEVYILSSTIDPGDYQKASEYSCVKKFLAKPLTAEHLKTL